jgi:Tfp pilus assembly protein PilN
MQFVWAQEQGDTAMIERINLVPQRPFAEKVKMALPIVLGTLVAVVLVTAFFEYQILSYKLNKVDKELTTIKAEKGLADQLQSKTQTLKTTVARLQNHHSELQKSVTELDITQSKNKYFSRALSAITYALPDTVKCTKIVFENNTGQITGNAVQYSDLPDLVTRLKNNPLFKNAALKNVDKSNNADSYQLSFNIKLELQ